MGFRLSRKIRRIRNNILQKIEKKNLKLYKLLLFVGAIFKFLYKFNKKKIKKVYSKNLDEINKYEFKKTSQNNEDGIIDSEDNCPLNSNPNQLDNDGDGRGNVSTRENACFLIEGYVALDGDCQDNDANLNPFDFKLLEIIILIINGDFFLFEN